MAPRKSGKAGTATLERREKMRTALELRKAGKTYEQIAHAVGYKNRGDAYDLVRDAIREVTREPAQDVLTLELERLDAALSALWPAVGKGDEKAILRMLGIMDRRAKYLGLDTTRPPDVSDEARTALAGLMGALTAAATPAGEE